MSECKLRVVNHPILGRLEKTETVNITIDGKAYKAVSGEVIAAALMANGIIVHRHSSLRHEPRGVYCGIGQCTDCVMVVNGKANVRTCITPVEEGMDIRSQYGVGEKRNPDD